MALLFSPASVVWVILMLATATSTWWVSKDAATASTATVLIMVIAAIKVRLVLIHFMDLGHAPLRWRVLFEAWIVVCTAIILGVYLH